MFLRSSFPALFLQTPPSLRATSPNLGEESRGMPNGNVKTENGKLIAHPLPILLSPLTVVFLQTPPSLRATSPNLEEESGWGLLPGFRF